MALVLHTTPEGVYLFKFGIIKEGNQYVPSFAQLRQAQLINSLSKLGTDRPCPGTTPTTASGSLPHRLTRSLVSLVDQEIDFKFKNYSFDSMGRPRYDDPAPLIAGSVILGILAITCVGLRFYSNSRRPQGIITSDWLILPALFLGTGQAAMEIYGECPHFNLVPR